MGGGVGGGADLHLWLADVGGSVAELVIKAIERTRQKR